MLSQEKKAVFLRFSNYLEKVYNYGIKRKLRKKRSDDDDGGFQQQIAPHLVDRYEHMNSRNDHWMVRLKVVPLA